MKAGAITLGPPPFSGLYCPIQYTPKPHPLQVILLNLGASYGIIFGTMWHCHLFTVFGIIL